MNDRVLLEASFHAAVRAADPAHTIAAALPTHSQLLKYARVKVLGAGKAAASMARALEAALPPSLEYDGLVVTRYGHGAPTKKIKVIEASHPVPDTAGQAAAQQIFDEASALGPDDLLIMLISGGGSSLLSLPAEGVSMDDLRQVTLALLASGAPIEQMNIVRKHLSRIQGGRLAQATLAQVLVLVISDVAGDEFSAIASGPCAPDPSTFLDAQLVLQRWSIDAPSSVVRKLADGAAGLIMDTPKSNDPTFNKVQHRLIAFAHKSLEAAASVFKAAGIQAVILGDTVTGEARDVAQVMAAITREVLIHQQPFKGPVALISGGECTVTLRASDVHKNGPKSRGGRCSEFLLALVDALGPLAHRVCALAADTDGIDGSEDNAGAIWLPDMLDQVKTADISPRKMLDANDAWGFFDAVDGLLYTGPTLTNVNDYRVILVGH